MKTNIEERACRLAEYIIENNATVRTAARKFGISKSTVHTEGTNWNGYQKKSSPRISGPFQIYMGAAVGLRLNFFY